MLFKYAFRNVLRQRKRTLVSASVVLIGAVILAFAQAFVTGMVDAMEYGYIDFQSGSVRVTTEEFYERERFMPVDAPVYDSDYWVETFRSLELTTAVEERVRFGILLGHGDNTVEAFGMGVDIENSELDIPEKIIEGEILGSGIYIGKGLAEKLGAEIGDELLLATQTTEGGLNGIKLPVAGFFDMNVSMFNNQYFFVQLDDAKRLLKLDDWGATTEILLFTEHPEDAFPLKDEVEPLIDDDMIALTFADAMGGMYILMEAARYIYVFFEGLILFLASFVIINTMMIAIFERVDEIGMMKAMGMTDNQVFWNFTLEGALIGAIGGVPGAVLGYLLIAFLGRNGMSFEDAMQGTDFVMDYMVYPRTGISTFLIILLVSLLVPAITAMIPARYTKKLTPSEALRQ